MLLCSAYCSAAQTLLSQDVLFDCSFFTLWHSAKIARVYVEVLLQHASFMILVFPETNPL